MSAYVVNDETINKVVAYLENESYNSTTSGSCKRILKEAGYDLENGDVVKLANDMFALNVRAIDERYGEGEAAQFRPLDFQYRRVMPQPAVRTVKVLQCWIYQCSEGTVPDTDLYKVMAQVSNAMFRGIVMKSEAYDIAPWG